MSGGRQDNNDDDLRRAAEAILWNMPGTFANVKGEEMDALINTEVGRLMALPDKEQQKAINTGTEIINSHKENFKRQLDTAAKVSEFLTKRDAGDTTANQLYEAMYSELEKAIGKSLQEAYTAGKPALIVLGEYHHREESIAAEMIALHIGQKKDIKHCITESNGDIDFFDFDKHKDNPTKLSRGITHLPFAVLQFGKAKGINIVNGCDSFYFSEGSNALSQSVGPRPPEEEKEKFDEWESKATIICRISDEQRNETTNKNVDKFISEKKEPCIMIVGAAHLTHLARLTGKGNCIATLIDVSSESPEQIAHRPWLYDPGTPVINLADLTKETKDLGAEVALKPPLCLNNESVAELDEIKEGVNKFTQEKPKEKSHTEKMVDINNKFNKGGSREI